MKKRYIKTLPNYTYVIDYSCCYIQNNDTLEFDSINSCDYESSLITIIENGYEKELSISTVLKLNSSLFIRAKSIIDTQLNAGLYTAITKNASIKKISFNTFRNANLYTKIRANDKFNNFSNNINIFLKEFHSTTPAFMSLIENLFYYENPDVIFNFLCFIHNFMFLCQRQDKYFLFFGYSSSKTGQGAGKGLLVSYLAKLIDQELIGSITNDSYLTSFNQDLINKPLIIFDEVHLRALKYYKIKELTGSDYLRIEQKGQDAFYTKNIMSLIMFSNESTLNKDILETDRRVFLINPNPNHSSIKKIMNQFGGEKEYLRALDIEKNNVISILYHHCNHDVKDPLNLRTVASIRYFNRTKEITVDTVKEHLELIGVNRQFRLKLLKMFEEENFNFEYYDSEKKAILREDIITKDLLKEIANFLMSKNLYKKGFSITYFWHKSLDKAIENGIVVKKIKLKKTNYYSEFKRTLIFDSVAILTNEKLLEIKRKLRLCYSKRTNNDNT